MTRQIDIQGHRGARGLFPENTLEGFVAASALGVTAFELDVGMTSDGVVVVTHDPVLNPDIVRGPDGRWLSGPGPTVWSLRYADLRMYDVGRLRPGSRVEGLFPAQVPQDGARVPTLAAVLKALPDTRFTIEVKTDPTRRDWTAEPAALAEATLAVVDAAGAAERVMIEAFDWRVQRHLRRVRPSMNLAWLTRGETVANAGLWWDGVEALPSVAAVVAAEGGAVWAPDYSDLTEAQVLEAHALGLRVMPWTVNLVKDMRRLIAWGVDGLITDRPDLGLGLVG
jgi:glycerophosphoryl diester phosphodiesterase